jgi:CBS domain-containing protein/SAM-dependent methyltransferase
MAIVRDVMLFEFDSVSKSESLADVDRRMRDLGLGALPVCADDGTIEGILLRRDIRALRERGGRLEQMTAADVVRVVTPAGPDDTLEAALDLLRTQEMGRLPVTENGRSIGIVTRGDVLSHARIRRELGPALANLSMELSPDEEMLEGSRMIYLGTAVDALACIKRALEAAGTTSVGSILDFACGHGRVLRVLKAVFPDATLAVCDINRDGVDFCARTFGARPFYSAEDPADIQIEGKYDLIWCGSLLTHLDSPRWAPFLELWRSLLSPSGLFVFTTHGRSAADGLASGQNSFWITDDEIETMLRDYERDGFGYADYRHRSGYGISICSREWTTRLVTAQPGLRIVRF